MRKILCFILLLFTIHLQAQHDNAPVVGVSDKRVEVYGLKNASVVVDYQTTLENTDILISDGRIESIGSNLSFPRGTIIYDLTGKTVYPSFVDIYAGNYGIKAPAAGSGTNAMAAFYNPQQAGRSSAAPTTEPRVADYWNDGIHASFNMSDEFIPDTKVAAEYRQAGFGSVVAFKETGIARGSSALVSTADGKANTVIIKNKASANYTLGRSRSADRYPAAQFGIIALLRQVNFDAQWYKQLPAGYFQDDGLEAYNLNLSLPQIIEVSNKIEVLRADRLGKEFGIDYIIKGGGDEYQTLNDIKKAGNKLIIPINFPASPNVKDPYDMASVTYTALKHYELAPSNLSEVSKAGITFAITSSDLSRRTTFLTNLRKAVKYGLSEKEALKALTTNPASLIGASDLVGAVKKNMIANLLVTSGDIFKDDCVIYENWVQGKPYRLVDLRIKEIKGTYALKVDTASYKMVLAGADESAWAVKDFLKDNNIPVLLSNTQSLPKYEYSDIRLPFKLAAMFKNEGILVGLTYSKQAYSNLPFVAGQTVAYGLTREEALQTVTLNTAKILGIDDLTGSLELGKDANIVVSTGDILDMLTNNIEYAFITGRNIVLDDKHKKLYRRFQAKYENMK